MTPAAVAELVRRRLSDARLAEIYTAALDVLADVGYDRMTMDAVAARAKASKATLYRHWPGKSELVVDAVRHLREETTATLPDTGTLRGDLRAHLGGVTEHAGDAQVCMMRGMIAACARDAELAQIFQEQLVDAKRGATMTLLERARMRGEIGDGVDLDLVVDVAPAMLVFRRLLTTHVVDDAYLDRLVDEVWLPLLRPSEVPVRPT